MWKKPVCVVLVPLALLLVAADKEPPKPEWTLDLDKMKAPEAPVSGKVGGNPFKAEKVAFDKFVTTVTFRQGKNFFPDEAITLFLFLKQGESPEGKTFEVDAKKEAGLHPHVHLQQTAAGEKLPKTDIYTSDYSLKLTFGKAKDGKIPGTIYLSLSDKAKSVIAGSFEMELK